MEAAAILIDAGGQSKAMNAEARLGERQARDVDLQAAQAACIDTFPRPGQHGRKTTAGQQLLDTPGKILSWLNDHQTLRQQAGITPCGGIRQIRRRHQRNPSPCRRQLRQRRQDQGQFAQTAAVNQHFRQISTRPALTRRAERDCPARTSGRLAGWPSGYCRPAPVGEWHRARFQPACDRLFRFFRYACGPVVLRSGPERATECRVIGRQDYAARKSGACRRIAATSASRWRRARTSTATRPCGSC